MMAPLLRVQFAVLLGLLFLSVTVTARPCRTFLISSYSFSFPANADRNPYSVTTFTEIRSFIPLHIAAVKPYLSGEFLVDRALPSVDEDAVEIDRHRRAPFGFSADDFSSLRDRTKDILSVVVALLFGVGCGALTAATLYLAWSMFANRHEDYRASYDGFLDGDDEKIESPKKMGYEKIPAKEAWGKLTGHRCLFHDGTNGVTALPVVEILAIATTGEASFKLV